MQGASAGGSPEREAGAGERLRGPGRGRRVRFRMPHTTIAVPSCRDEEQLFYRRLDALGALGPDGFAPLFAAEGWSEVTEDRLLRKRVVRDGRGGAPQPGQEVSVKVLGALEDGGLVERDPRLSFVPGQGDAVQALELGVPTMRAGEVCFFLAASPYGYGRVGREPDVPPEAPLVFEVTLLEVRDGPDPQLLPPAARLRLGAQKRERGNVHFARGDFAAALLSYRLALSALEGAGEERRDGTGADRRPASPPGPHEEELREQRVKCLNNCAAAARRLQRGAEALAAVEAALRLSPDNGTALLRRGQLLAEDGRDEEAARVLRRALELDPASKVRGAARRGRGSAPAATLQPRGSPAARARGALPPGQAPRPRRRGAPRPSAATAELRGGNGPARGAAFRTAGAPHRPRAHRGGAAAALPAPPAHGRGPAAPRACAAAPGVIAPAGGTAAVARGQSGGARPPLRANGRAAGGGRGAAIGRGAPLKSAAGAGRRGGSAGRGGGAEGGRERHHDPREPTRAGAAEEPEEAERFGQGQTARRRALGRRPQAEGLGDNAAEAEEGGREEGGQQVAAAPRGRCSAMPRAAPGPPRPAGLSGSAALPLK